MKNFIITAVGLALIITFGFLRRVWAPFIYFALAFIMVLSIYWLVVLIKDYIHNYYKDIDEDFKLYKAKLINSSEITLEQIEKSPKYYLKKFRRTQWKEKGIDILKISFVLGILIAGIILCFTL